MPALLQQLESLSETIESVDHREVLARLTQEFRREWHHRAVTWAKANDRFVAAQPEGPTDQDYEALRRADRRAHSRFTALEQEWRARLDNVFGAAWVNAHIKQAATPVPEDP